MYKKSRKSPFLKRTAVVSKSSVHFMKIFVKWAFISAVTGCIGGFIGMVFHMAVEHANEIRMEHTWLILTMPIGGFMIVGLYKFFKMTDNHGTDDIIESVRSEDAIPFRTAPLIFISTVITHLVGGSSGREGAALQVGGSIGYQVGRYFNLDEKDKNMAIMCGMSALFAALFGTPLTSTIFAIEVISVGVMYYSGLIPCMVSALTAYSITRVFGIEPTFFALSVVPDANVISIAQVSAVSVLCAGLSVIFCMMLHGTAGIFAKFINNSYLRILAGSVIVILLTFIVGCTDYNGSGVHIIQNAINGGVRPSAFVLKMVFTAVTIGAGFKGGEIVPTFFVGATFGCLIAGLIGLEPGFGAAVGMIAMFCGMLNCPIASIILSIEMFGQNGLILFAIAAGISYMLSGYYGLYHSQKIIYSKLRAEFVNKSAR